MFTCTSICPLDNLIFLATALVPGVCWVGSGVTFGSVLRGFVSGSTEEPHIARGTSMYATRTERGPARFWKEPGYVASVIKESKIVLFSESSQSPPGL